MSLSRRTAARSVRMLGVTTARTCLEELAAKGRIVQRLDVDHIAFPTWVPVDA